GRNYLAGTGESFDAIVSDLFVPWHAGTGSLYAVEHYRAAFDRLAPGGLYCQWLQLDQFSRREFDIVAATFASVFRDVRLVRGDIAPDRALMGLVGWRDRAPVEPPDAAPAIRAVRDGGPMPEPLVRDPRDLALFDCGALASPAPGTPVNTDDR